MVKNVERIDDDDDDDDDNVDVLGIDLVYISLC